MNAANALLASSDVNGIARMCGIIGAEKAIPGGALRQGARSRGSDHDTYVGGAGYARFYP